MHKKMVCGCRDGNRAVIVGTQMMPLGLLSGGESGEVIEIRECGVGANPCASGKCGNEHGRIEDMGIRAGKTIEMLNNGGGGPLLIRIDESRIAVARSMAMKIMVRRKE